MKSKTNFDRFLEEQLRDPQFAKRFKQAGAAWDVAVQLATLRKQAGFSQTKLARKLNTTQQQISRLESPDYEGHSLSMLRRVARVLNVQVRVIFEAKEKASPGARRRAINQISIQKPGEKRRLTSTTSASFSIYSVDRPGRYCECGE